MKFDRFTPEWDADAKVECELPEHMERVEELSDAAIDFDRYRFLAERSKGLMAAYGVAAWEMGQHKATVMEMETIKNRHGGMPPKLP